jgi:superfamily II DNA or RNA helicase
LLKQVWRLRDVPTSVLSKINIPSHDQGIDLIAETFEGKFWAIQCKYHGDSDKKVSHREISTFLALSNTVASNISFCLVITTADDYAKLYKGQSNIGFVLSDVWSELPEGFFTEFGKPKKQHLGTPREPRKHQQSAISDATKYFEKEDRGKLIFPCGAGKSLTGYWISKALKAKNVVVAVPSLALVKQTLDDYCRESLAEGNPIAPFCICSDEGIGKSDDVAVFSQDLGINCTTDREKIKDFLKLKTDRKKVIFTTYQSGRVLGDAVKEIPFEFDLGILDEAHKTVGAADKLFSYLLFDDNVNIRKRIFMTATERRYKGSSDNILSMDDPEIYGDTFTQLSFKEAIDLEILSDYKIITLLITKDEVKEYLKQNDIVYGTELGDNAEVDFRTYASLIALRKAMDKYPIKHAVTFHGSIKRAKLFSELQEPFEEVYPKFSKVSAYHVTGAIPTGIRTKIVREFAGAEKAIITNAKCLTEGVDVPNIDCVLFADPRNSTVDIVQAVGRALRRAGDKEFGYVLLPIYSEEKNGEALLESEDFQNVLSTLRALASNDERIVEFFRDKHSVSNSAGVKDLIQFDVENIASGISINTTLLIEQLELKTWSRLAKLSWRPFDEAKLFVHSLSLKNENDWRKYIKSGDLPADIPKSPNAVYQEWRGMGDFLGTGNVAPTDREFLTFDEAKKIVRDFKIKNQRELKEFIKSKNCPAGFPSNPNSTYKNHWKGLGDFLGTNTISPQDMVFYSYEEAKRYVIKNKIRNKEEYYELKRKNPLLPANPRLKYKEFKNWFDFLGKPEKEFYGFEELKLILKDKGIKTQSDYKAFQRLDSKAPSQPERVYKNEWKNYGDFLGTNSVANQNRKFFSFEEAKLYVKKFNLKTQKDFYAWCKKGFRPLDLPSNPQLAYKSKGWNGWADFLGKDIEK